MVILEEPYASTLLLDWLRETSHPVLRSRFTERLASEHGLNLVDNEEAVQRINSGERVYTNSENALSWIVENTNNEDLLKGIKIFKDKASTREKLRSLDPDLFFKVVDIDELVSIDPTELPLPIILKPSVGFCSMGVYTIENEDDWSHALDSIKADSDTWRNMYPESVIETDTFVLEGYIDGQEYAIDIFYDSEGNTHILNILKHDFASKEDTSDRMYTTNAHIFQQMEPIFNEWLSKVNGIMHIKNFPMHVEVRVNNDHISPIEFNPLRFAGLGGTDVSYYAYGYKTYAAYLEDELPDFAEAFKCAGSSIYTMSLLNPPEGITGKEDFDYESFCSNFSDVLEMRKFDVNKVGNYGFLFLRVSEENQEELDFLLHDDLRRFLR